MKHLYITANFESVQPHLIESLMDSGIETSVFYHTMAHKSSMPQLPQYVSTGNGFGRAFGPIFYFMRLRQNAKKCLRMLRNSRKDITHGNMMFCDGYICRKIYQRFGIPYIICVRNTDLNTKFLWMVPWIRRMGIKVLLDAKQIVFLSRTGHEQLLEKLPLKERELVAEKCCEIPNGIDAYFLNNVYHAHSLDGSVIHLIFVGKVDKRKNPEAVIGAMDALNRRGVECDLTVVGPIGESAYDDMIRSDPRIRYFPRCPKEEVLEHLRAADIFVLPSHRETFGLVYAEAMSQGLPVIYTKGQGFDGQYDDGVVGYAVLDDAPETIAECVSKIITEYGTISQNCLDHCTRYNWKQIADTYKRLFEEITADI